MASPDVKAIYNDQYAEKYLGTIGNPYTRLKIATVADRIASVPVRQGSSHIVLDIGGNIHGTVTNGLRGALEKKDQGYYHTALDLSAAYFDTEFLKSKYSEVQVFPVPHGIVGDAKQIPLGADTVDTIVLADVLEHIPGPHDVTHEASRVLKPDGRFLLISPSLYKLDVFKNTRPEIDDAVSSKRPSSHVNFFDSTALDSVLHVAGFDTVKQEGLGFATGFPYLLWQDADYVTADGYSSPLSDKFKRISKTLSNLDSSVHAAIDTEMNKPEFGEQFIQSFITDRDRHPLDMIFEVLAVHPEFDTNDNLQSTYADIKGIVDQEKVKFDPAQSRELLSTFLEDNPYAYLANSVFVEARKSKSTH